MTSHMRAVQGTSVRSTLPGLRAQSGKSRIDVRLPAVSTALALVLAMSPAYARAAGARAAAEGRRSGLAKSRSKSERPKILLHTVVVSGQRAAIMTAQRIKEFSTQIVDAVVAADIGKLPDRSVTEVLQRIPGIAIDHTVRNLAGAVDPEHFQVEGAGISIRGLTYVRSEINGGDAFTANGGRALSFQDIPPELLAGIDVYKNPDAEQIEGGIGGVVNLRTAMPFDFSGLRLSGTLGGAWGDLSRGRPEPSASVLFSDRWRTGIGDIGVLADLAYSKARDRTDGMELYPYFPRTSAQPNSSWVPAGKTVWIPDGGVTWRSVRFHRTREGAYVALQWRPAENLETSLTYFGSFYKFHWNENAIFPQTDPYNIQPAPGTNFTYNSSGMLTQGVLTDPTDGGMPMNDDTRYSDKRDATNDFTWNTFWNVNHKLTLRSNLQFVRSYTRGGDFTVATGVNIPWEKINLAGSAPVVSAPAAYLENPANYYWAFTMDGLSRAHGTEWAWRGDTTYDLGHGFFKSIHAGVRLMDRSAQTNLSEPGSGYNWAAVSQVWQLGWDIPTLAYLNKFPAPYYTYGFPNFFNGGVPVPSPVVFPAESLASGWPNSFALLQSFQTDLCKQLNPSCVNNWKPAALAGPGSVATGGLNTQAEHTYAAYVMLPFGTHAGRVPIDGNIGVRVVRTVMAANGYMTMGLFTIPVTPPPGHTLSQYVGFNASAEALAARNSYTDILPSLNMVFHWTHRLQSHLAISEGMARPSFSQLQAFTTLGSGIANGLQTFTGSANGNPNLKPTKAFQLDGTLEWYFSPTGSVTADVFYKHLTDVVINQVFDVTAKDTAGGTETFTTTGPINGASGSIKGIELAYQQYYHFLPWILRGLGTQVNFTYIDSSQTLDHPVTGAYCVSSTNGAANLALNLDGCDTNGQTFGNLPLVNLSKYLFNVALLYDLGPVSARLAYSWRSRYLMGVNVNPTQGTDGLNTDPSSPGFGAENVAWGLPLYAGSYGELDASLFYKIDSHITLGFMALNLTNSIYEELMQQHVATSVFARYDSGRTYTAQVRVQF